MKDKKKNILVGAIAASIGDTICYFAEGMIVFNGEPFELIFGMMGNIPGKYDTSYQNSYEDLRCAFSLCKKITMRNLMHLAAVRKYVETELLIDKTLNVHYVDDIGYENLRKNINDIHKYLPKYLVPKASGSIKKLFCEDQINVAFHIRRFKRKNDSDTFPHDRFFSRNADLQKWIDFIKCLANRYKDINFIGIGNSDKNSLSYISKEELSELSSLNNVLLPFLEQGTSISEDLYIIKESDLTIGGNSGPATIALLLGKPTIIYDYGYSRELKKIGRFPIAGTQQQLWGHQTLYNMLVVFTDCFNMLFSLSKEKTAEEIKVLKRAELKNAIIEYVSFMDDSTALDGWKDYYEAYYRLGVDYLKHKQYRQAKDCLHIAKTNYLADDFYQFYMIARLLKDANIYQEAKYYFKEAIAWAKVDKRQDILAAAVFHLGEILFNEKMYDDALDCFSQCLFINRVHQKAREYLLEILILLKLSIVVWGTGLYFERIIVPVLDKLNLVCIVDNNSRLWDTTYNGIDVFSPMHIKVIQPDIVLVASMHGDEILSQVEAMSFAFNMKKIIV